PELIARMRERSTAVIRFWIAVTHHHMRRERTAVPRTQGLAASREVGQPDVACFGQLGGRPRDLGRRRTLHRGWISARGTVRGSTLRGHCTEQPYVQVAHQRLE